MRSKRATPRHPQGWVIEARDASMQCVEILLQSAEQHINWLARNRP
jgi:hypothetical protein